MASAWLITLPAAALVGAGAEGVARAIGGTWGVVADLVMLLAVAGTIYFKARGNKVDHNNVNDEWEQEVVTDQPEPAAA
jgi:PiT family inorganic phosphate transporter